MKKLLLIITLAIFGLKGLAQDSTQKAVFLIRPYFENGIDFIQNEQLEEMYQTKTKYFWTVGIQLGHPDINNAFPYIQYTESQFAFNYEDILSSTEEEYMLKSQQMVIGLVIPIKRWDKNNIRGRIGYSYAKVQEDFNEIENDSYGFQFGIGVERKIFGRSRIYLDLTYNYQKAPKTESFRDFDMTRLAFGFVF